jgi:hypothetical protein
MNSVRGVGRIGSSWPRNCPPTLFNWKVLGGSSLARSFLYIGLAMNTTLISKPKRANFSHMGSAGLIAKPACRKLLAKELPPNTL